MKFYTDSNISEVVDLLNLGKIGIVPFDTSYGLVCDATNTNAVNLVWKYKNKLPGKPIPIAVNSKDMAEKYVELNQDAINFYNQFLPGAFTVVSESKRILTHLESDLSTIGVRIPDSRFILDIISKLGRPIICTGANKYYEPPVYDLNSLFRKISNKRKETIDFVVDVGKLKHKQTSMVVDTTKDMPTILRRGVGLENIKGAFDKVSYSKFLSHSIDQTVSFGRSLIRDHKHQLKYLPILLCLEGDMGAGKTTLTRGIASEFGLEESVSSPSFLVMNEYYNSESSQKIYHIDTWRLDSEHDLVDLDLNTISSRVNKSQNYPLILVEWADKYLDFFLNRLEIRKKLIWIKISRLEQFEECRNIEYAELN